MPAPDPAYRGDDSFIFVSYSHADEAAVNQEIRRLQDQGIHIWYDSTGISAGAEWSEQIARAIRGASTFLCFITPSSVASEHCRRELAFAQSLGRPVIAVHLNETDIPDGLRLSLENRQAILRYRLASDVYEDLLLDALGGNEKGQQAVSAPSKTADKSVSYRLPVAVSVLAVAALLAFFWMNRGEPIASQNNSIAVLPFTDLSSTADQQHFGDGIADQILDGLSGLDGLQVVARTSSFAYRGEQNLRRIAEDLGVTTILEGSIRRDGDRVRINAQLINAEDGFQLWSNVYERELTDVFAIQDEIAAAVAGALGVTLGVGDVNTFSGAGTTSVDAYEIFLKARGVDNAAKAIRLLERAVELDPQYAAAWAQLGLRTASTMWSAVPEDAPQIIDEAIAHLLKAVELEPNSAYAYSLLGTVNYALMDWQTSEKYFQQSLAISAEDETLMNYGNMLMRSGRSSAALNTFESANLPITYLGANAYLALGAFDSVAPQTMSIVLRSTMEFTIALNERNEATVETTLAKISRTGIAWTRFKNAVLGNFDDREKVLAVLGATLSDPNAMWPSKYNDIGLLAAYFGDPELALKAIEREFRSTTIRLYTLWYPVMREVRQLPELKQLLIDINLPTYWREHGWSDHCRQIGETDFECG